MKSTMMRLLRGLLNPSKDDAAAVPIPGGKLPAISDSEWSELINVSYQCFLGRAPKREELGYWANVRSGPEPIGALMRAVRESEEAKTRVYQPSVLEQPPSSSEDEAAIPTLYRLCLGRDASDGDVQFWIDILRRDRKGIGWLVQELHASAEAQSFRSRTNPLQDATTRDTDAPQAHPGPVDLSDPDWEEVVSISYRLFLGREPEAAEYGRWTDVRSGPEPITALVEAVRRSQEASSRTIQPAAPEQCEFTSDDEAAVATLYRLCFGRVAADEEIRFWLDTARRDRKNLGWLVQQLSTSDEARLSGPTRVVLSDEPAGMFVLRLYHIVLGRGPTAAEVAHWEHRLRARQIGRESLLLRFFNQRLESETRIQPGNDPTRIAILGTRRVVGLKDWQEPPQSTLRQTVPEPPPGRFPYLARPRPRVAILTSLYRGGRYMRQYLDNMMEQTIFEDCELVIIDADSPEGEYEMVKGMINRPNIRYERLPERVGIYEAWNMAVELTRAPYLTNANLDDLRRSDSFELQASTLDALPFVDVVYQDFYLSFDDRASFEDVASRDLKSSLPVITPNNLMSFNSPHNAPMWRRSLHDELGMFDPSFKTAGDYDFWIRCIAAGKCFYKLNDPHVSYFVNPRGLSTHADTLGAAEVHRIHTAVGSDLISPHLTQSIDDFRRACGVDSDPSLSRYEIATDALMALHAGDSLGPMS